jgi:uncharacterized protein YdeI (YjbR/CyaY-like superfamily)
MKGAKSADEFILSNPNWEEALILLRDIFLSARLDETIKWGVPVYTFEGKNVAGMACFKSYLGIWFYQGALLTDKARKLINAQEKITKALRQWRFSSIDEVIAEAETISNYVEESIENVRNGIEIKPEKDIPLQLPEVLADILKNEPSLRENFDALTLSKRRDFAEYINSAKRIETKMARMEKIIPMIRRREGLNDKYIK